MTNSIKIGKYLVTELKANSAITAAVGDKIFPFVAKEGTLFPFVVYTRQNVDCNYCKDGNHSDTVSVQISVYTDTYEEGLNIANMVRSTLEWRTIITPDNTIIKSIVLDGVGESFHVDTYAQVLTFKMTVQ